MTDNVAIFNTMAKTLTDSELRSAIHILCEERDERGVRKTEENRWLLKEDDRVEWTGRLGACTGRIVRVKRKKCIVVEDKLNGRWDIPMSMLTKIS